ncbi:MAG TPA: endo alpha-1,4 polygalactosaminidase [Hyphomicrobiaceae bacterium]|nr:endo alpha-1,4 polygalactosaminidase [Hyphomicrobiaceae bacterium]
MNQFDTQPGLVGWLMVMLRAAWGWVRVLLHLVPIVWSAIGRIGRRLVVAAAIIAALAALLSDWRVPLRHWMDSGNRPLLAAKSWYFYLDSFEIDRALQNKSDMFVIDHAHNHDNRPLTKEDLARLKARPGEKPRLLISYFSIGEAESYRFYWRKDWDEDPPGWYVAENCAWPRNYMVRFWHDGWKDIIYRGKRSYLARIIEAGFDGVYLDRVDVFDNLTEERPTAKEDMIDFVIELARTARKLKPGFIVIAQNGEDLLRSERYRAAIDGLGKEDLLYGVHGTEKRNPKREIDDHWRNIRLLLRDWKPVFAVEYVAKPELISSARKELQSLGLVPTFAHRSLDGYDPGHPRPPPKIEYGTPEWVAANCKDKKHW